MSGPEWDRFVQEIMEDATWIKGQAKTRYFLRTDNEIHEDLDELDSSLTKALECIERLGFLPQPEGSLARHNPAMHRLFPGLGPKLVVPLRALTSQLEEVRNAARRAAERARPGKGNAPNRTPVAVLRATVGEHFVFSFVTHFGHLPPRSNSGHVSDALTKMAGEAGIPGDIDVNALLKQSVAAYVAPLRGFPWIHIPTAAEARAARGKPTKTE